MYCSPFNCILIIIIIVRLATCSRWCTHICNIDVCVKQILQSCLWPWSTYTDRAGWVLVVVFVPEVLPWSSLRYLLICILHRGNPGRIHACREIVCFFFFCSHSWIRQLATPCNLSSHIESSFCHVIDVVNPARFSSISSTVLFMRW